MKKIFLVLLVLAVVGGSAFAWEPLQYPPSVKGGNVLLDLGIGLGSVHSGGKMSIPPLFVQGEYCLPTKAPISVGAQVAFSQYKWNWGYLDYTDTWTYIYFGARGNWHWNIDLNWLDLYTGINLGYNYFKWSTNYPSYTGSEPNYGGLEFGGQVGAHFYFSKNVGVVAEFGYPYWLKAGLALKF